MLMVNSAQQQKGLHIGHVTALMVVSFVLHSTEDRKLIRIVLMKTNRDAGNCWTSLLENEYAADPWVQDQMQRKLTLERFQREASQRRPHLLLVFCVCRCGLWSWKPSKIVLLCGAMETDGSSRQRCANTRYGSVLSGGSSACMNNLWKMKRVAGWYWCFKVLIHDCNNFSLKIGYMYSCYCLELWRTS